MKLFLFSINLSFFKQLFLLLGLNILLDNVEECEANVYNDMSDMMALDGSPYKLNPHQSMKGRSTCVNGFVLQVEAPKATLGLCWIHVNALHHGQSYTVHIHIHLYMLVYSHISHRSSNYIYIYIYIYTGTWHSLSVELTAASRSSFTVECSLPYTKYHVDLQCPDLLVTPQHGFYFHSQVYIYIYKTCFNMHTYNIHMYV